jgi:hypothetical protein
VSAFVGSRREPQSEQMQTLRKHEALFILPQLFIRGQVIAPTFKSGLREVKNGFSQKDMCGVKWWLKPV